ncbi:hypothetical protein PNEG_02824 [Pneumocystis murina B123]|uniref:Exonuclease domain-containing protein n=1 Tax=Pneumocystis murina (strain B123) TaxID=1069680 RepID=M7NK92_PNEMU|nr:hypothetical protein PNEG_02824 [Pneumocystis murina B123]EMR09053.1 hypothetical protein PNEG_02824 [Pneumocystis murina B123]
MNEENIQEYEKKTSEKRKRNDYKLKNLDRNEDICMNMDDYNPFKVLENDGNSMSIRLEDIESGKRSKKESKKKRYPTLKITNTSPERYIGIGDLRDVVLWVIGNTSAPSWVAITNKSSIKKIVVLLIPGLDPTLFNLDTDCVLTNSPVPLEQCCPDKLQNFKKIFSYVIPTRTPGERYKVHSPISSFLQCPLSNAEKICQSEKLKSKIQKKYLPENYLMSYSELVERDYPLHSIFPDSKPLPSGWKETPIPENFENSLDSKGKKILALDCEMCKTENGPELTRVTLVDWNSQIIYDELVKPDSPIVDYLTQYSGITEERLSDITTRITDVQETLLKLIDKNTIIVGHSLEWDFRSLKFAHPYIIDTSSIFQHTRGPPYKPGLKWLAHKWLKREIQKENALGHDSIEDALTCIDLLKLKLKNGPEFGLFNIDNESIFSKLEKCDETKKCAVIDYGGPGQWYRNSLKTFVSSSSDDEILEGVLKNIDSHDFIWARFRELEYSLGWAGNSVTKNIESVDNAFTKLNERVYKLYTRLPKYTILLIYSGTGDPREMLKFNSKKNAFNIEFKTKKWEECENKWDDNDNEKLALATNKARRGISFITLK